MFLCHTGFGKFTSLSKSFFLIHKIKVSISCTEYVKHIVHWKYLCIYVYCLMYILYMYTVLCMYIFYLIYPLPIINFTLFFYG